MNITTDDGTPNQNQDLSREPEPNELTNTMSDTNSHNIQAEETTSLQPGTMVYSQAILRASSSGAIPKQIPKKPPEVKRQSKEMEQILKLHENGIRTLIILRGAAGSGKTHLARNIVDKIYGCLVPGYWSLHIFSTDDYFMRGGRYNFNRVYLPEAHRWNQERAYAAMSKGISPIIIDNTNMEIWEMQPYVKVGVHNSYVLVMLEPNTPWAKKVGQLVKRNVHNVPTHSIINMLDRYEPATCESLLASLGFSHSINSISNVKRTYPEFIPRPVELSESQTNNTGILEPQSSGALEQQENNSNIERQMQNLKFSEKLALNVQKNEAYMNNSAAGITAPEVSTSIETNLENMNVYKEVEKHLEEVAKIECEWDNGENWDDNSASKENMRETKQKLIEESKHLPQRKLRPEKKLQSEKLLPPMENVQDWTMFMPMWDKNSTSHAEQSLAPLIEMSTSGTSMEIGDTVLSDLKNPFKVITATPRDINEFFVNERSFKIPDKWMLDKSTSTINEVMHTPRCKNEDKHFNEFRKLFKYIPRSALKDVFDKCHGDVNWAVDIVLSDMSEKQSDIQDDELLESDNDDENCENIECDCVAVYNVIPDHNTAEEIKPESPVAPEAKMSSPLPVKRKIKKDNNHSDAFAQIKQKIEQNIVISDDHYSEHSLKIRKYLRGEKDVSEEVVKTCEDETEADTNKENLPSTSNVPADGINDQAIHSTSNNTDESDDETISTVDEVEKTISIDVTKDLMSQLDEHFGWKEMVYSSNISTKINVPISILNELNAIWIESLLFQIEENSKQLEIMVKQDEEFARQMVQKEAELLRTVDEPGIPDFKEIMDMDYALSLYHKDVAQWRNNEPSDLAAKLSRDKLKKLFPDLSEDSLSEILMAHDNNFKITVEALLLSTGKSDIMLAHNGVSKFIMDNENEQREKLLNKEETTLSETEWPPLPENEEINMDLVRKYREEAEKHLKFRNMSHQKAQELMRRGLTPAATFYSEIAAYHKMKYEQSNSYAAASLIHLHANSGNEGDTVDLHFLHVNEAKESLDLFLDEHIQILRNKNGPRYQKLFFITGRGLHSNGRPKIKPAVKKRLRERGLRYSETNPGLISAKVSATSVLANELG
ncbi:NEDD4-binding protein 2 isoform X2 [Aricia agestis]|nr:NEDD4-binding protein 2 isoform X2 [Aricia agestis]